MARVTFFVFDALAYDWRKLMTVSAEVGTYESNPTTGGPMYSVRIKNRANGRSPRIMVEHAHVSMHNRQVTVTGFVRCDEDGQPLGVGEEDEYINEGRPVPAFAMTRLSIEV